MVSDTIPPLTIHEEVPGAPYHGFWLRSTLEHVMSDYTSVLAKEAPIRLSDVVMNYVADSMSWIPSRNPAYAHIPETTGLHLYGPTIIDQTGASLFRQICRAWASLFSAGPSPLILNTGSISFIGDDGSREEKWQRLRVDREAIVRTFQDLAHFADQTTSGTFYILHLGV